MDDNDLPPPGDEGHGQNSGPSSVDGRSEPEAVPLPIVESTILSEDQIAMLDLLRVNRVILTEPIDLLIKPDEVEKACGAEAYISRRYCPVVAWRGKQRIVMPDGALVTFKQYAAND